MHIKTVIFVFNGKISLQILLHVPKTTTKEQPLVLHTARHEVTVVFCVTPFLIIISLKYYWSYEYKTKRVSFQICQPLPVTFITSHCVFPC